ncbi:hypothetical protein I656_02498 [Geobacillus sp. WSUCF1]|nr:hypothetical protein I656_02498 [Geobacillus sp. WSUCF1]
MEENFIMNKKEIVFFHPFVELSFPNGMPIWNQTQKPACSALAFSC